MTISIDEFGEPFDIDEGIDIVHYGMPRRSGRYPWGSGDNPYQRSKDFISQYEELKKSGQKKEDIQFRISFDVIVETGKQNKFKGNITLELPTGNILEEGVSTLEITDLENIIFKRIK